ncbi:MAG TPA: cupin domain-containing protein [Clostridiales bacterium]|nr:cupin domain-containing protein [Clostridiales bacterium]
MIRRSYVPVKRENMRGGDGTVTINNWVDENEKCPNLRLAANLVLPKGASIGVHGHAHETEIFHVLSGEAEYLDNGKPETVGPGAVLVCADGEEHGIKNIGNGDLVLNAVIIKA